ncbi:hypothetical protein C0J52_19713 [Blattella germanica]|nr:hypothetical protein C0J52_19713 [Blattella germanica]
MLEQINNDNELFHKAVFSDDYIFHVSKAVYRHNCQIWGSINPHVTREIERDKPKINEQIPDGYIFQKNGSPLLYTNHVMDYLDQIFNGRWIGRAEPLPCSPRSPYLMPLGISFCGVHQG